MTQLKCALNKELRDVCFQFNQFCQEGDWEYWVASLSKHFSPFQPPMLPCPCLSICALPNKDTVDLVMHLALFCAIVGFPFEPMVSGCNLHIHVS